MHTVSEPANVILETGSYQILLPCKTYLVRLQVFLPLFGALKTIGQSNDKNDRRTL